MSLLSRIAEKCDMRIEKAYEIFKSIFLYLTEDLDTVLKNIIVIISIGFCILAAIMIIRTLRNYNKVWVIMYLTALLANFCVDVEKSVEDIIYIRIPYMGFLAIMFFMQCVSNVIFLQNALDTQSNLTAGELNKMYAEYPRILKDIFAVIIYCVSAVIVSRSSLVLLILGKMTAEKIVTVPSKNIFEIMNQIKEEIATEKDKVLIKTGRSLYLRILLFMNFTSTLIVVFPFSLMFNLDEKIFLFALLIPLIVLSYAQRNEAFELKQ